MKNLIELFKYEYVDSKNESLDVDWYNLEEALGLLMADPLSELQEAVALASLSSTINRIQKQGGWTYYYYMKFAETWRPLPVEARKTLLYLIVPRLTSEIGNPGTLWFIDAALDEKMYALLHLAFIEKAFMVPDFTMRAYAAYSLQKIPLSYWEETGQPNRRSELIERALNDPSDQVKLEINQSSSDTR